MTAPTTSGPTLRLLRATSGATHLAPHDRAVLCGTRRRPLTEVGIVGVGKSSCPTCNALSSALYPDRYARAERSS